MQVISGKIQKAKKVVLYGVEGIGKSSLAAEFPHPIFIDTEGSTTELDVNRLPRPTSWEMLKQQVAWVKNQDFKTLVIDTIDWAERLCNEHVCASHNKNGIEAFGYGAGYTFASEEMGRFLNLLSDLTETDINVVLIAHAQIIKFDQPDEMGSYDRYTLKLGQKTGSRTASMVKEWGDCVLFINYKTFSVATDKEGKKNKGQGGVRTVYATHHPAWDAKNRHGLPDEFPLDYGQIAHIFAKPASSSQAAPATPPSTPPVEATQPASESKVEESPLQTQQSSLDPNIPRSLRDLMSAYQVTESEIQAVVSQKGYYPSDTPITNYDPNFIEGVLVGAWPKVFEMVQSARNEIPFS